MTIQCDSSYEVRSAVEGVLTVLVPGQQVGGRLHHSRTRTERRRVGMKSAHLQLRYKERDKKVPS